MPKSKERYAKRPKAHNGANDKMTIRVTCQGNSTINLAEIHPLQGDLKSLSEENFGKLRESILKYGISFPFFLWRDKGKARILDGTQRDKVLKKMREEGYEIPPLPVDYIEARDEKEAKEKILLAASQYGEMTNDSLMSFLNESRIDFTSLESMLELPQIDLEQFKAKWLDPQPPGTFVEIDPENMVIEHVCPKCGYQFSGGRTIQKEK